MMINVKDVKLLYTAMQIHQWGECLAFAFEIFIVFSRHLQFYNSPNSEVWKLSAVAILLETLSITYI